MRRRGLLVMLGVATMIIGPVPAARRTSCERAGASACRLPSGNPARLAQGTTRDRDSLSHTQVADLLDDLHNTLQDRFGESDERRLGSRLPSTVVVPVRFHVLAAGDQGRLSK